MGVYGIDWIYTGEQFDFGGAAGTKTLRFRMPKGKTGLLVDYGVQNIQENFAGTTSATISVGTASDPDAYGEELALNGGTTTTGARTVRMLYDTPADIATYIVDKTIPADAVFTMTLVEAITGPTGQADPYFHIRVSN